jgi:hypothetical protein
MPTIAAADTSVRLTQKSFKLAASLAGENAVAWGRYFNGFHTTSAEYRPQEAARFEALEMKLIPIAQQTPKVNGSSQEGAANAAINVQKFLSRIGADHLAANGNEYLMFLDVEGDGQDNPSLSADYYRGWSQTLVSASRDQSGGRFTMVPAMYARTKDTTTWNALRKAEANGAERCRGVWVARQHIGSCKKARPDWEPDFLTPKVALQCPVLLWQYIIDCPDGKGVDVDLLNPEAAIQKQLLTRLIVPAA